MTTLTRAVGMLGIALLAPGSHIFAARGDTELAQDRRSSAIDHIVHDSMKKYNLKSVIVQVTFGGKSMYTNALRESMSGVAAIASMHFRNGAMPFTYMSAIFRRFGQRIGPG